MNGILGRRFMVLTEANIWNPQTLGTSNFLHTDFLTETLSSQGPCPQVNEKEVAHLGKLFSNSSGIYDKAL